MQQRIETADDPATHGSMTVPGSPVDDHTYNVLQALASTLESIEAYEIYAGDDSHGLFDELLEEQRRQAQRLIDELRTCLAI